MDFFGSEQPPAESDAPILLDSGGGDAPIILGGEAPEPSDAPAYLGDVNETPMMVPDDDYHMNEVGDAPIVLGPTGEEGAEDGIGGGDVEDDQAIVPTGPSPMAKWNEEWQETLKQRKDEENARKAELAEAARVALEQFAAEREQRREAKMAKNREDEQAKLEAIEADLENDNSWQKVCKMVELSHDSTAKAQDVKRMRDILILLKNESSRAEALS